MTEILIGAGVLVLAIGGFLVADALRRPGDEPDPEQPQNVERIRPQSEAYAAGARHDQLSQKDAATAAELTGWQKEISAEQPMVMYGGTRTKPKRRTVRRRIGVVVAMEQRAAQAAAAKRRAQAEAWEAFLASDPLTAPLPLVHKPAPVLSSVPKTLPTWDLESFTAGWTKSDIDRMVAEAKAGAK